MQTEIVFEHLWTEQGWLSPALVRISKQGHILATQPYTDSATKHEQIIRGYTVPGAINVHSHAFQRALAGRCELSTGQSLDNLWTWRQRMYAMAQMVSPEHYEAIAAFCYLEMVEHGFTRVADFHYVHHAPGGQRYSNPAEMGLRLAVAARQVGVGLSLLPTLYSYAGIGRQPVHEQLRFVHADVESYLNLLQTLLHTQHSHQATVGVALHSLRAVHPDQIQTVLSALPSLGSPQNLPIHIHVSETLQEVDECIAGLGARPIQWLLNNVSLNQHWTLLHATHVDAAEVRGMVQTGVLVGLCPMTEAMLGDGIFPLVEYHGMRGRWGIGTDSHYASSVVAELRMLECGQRLKHNRRNALVQELTLKPKQNLSSSDAALHHSGEQLWRAILQGYSAIGSEYTPGSLGAFADFVVLDAQASSLITHDCDTVLDAWLLSGVDNPVRDVMVGGRWIMQQRQHPQKAKIHLAYVQAMKTLLA